MLHPPMSANGVARWISLQDFAAERPHVNPPIRSGQIAALQG
jgi:hypothetical protein